MKIKKTESGTLLVPKRIKEDGIIGDTVLEIKPDHIDYKKYLAQYERDQELENQSRETRIFK